MTSGLLTDIILLMNTLNDKANELKQLLDSSDFTFKPAPKKVCPQCSQRIPEFYKTHWVCGWNMNIKDSGYASMKDYEEAIS